MEYLLKQNPVIQPKKWPANLPFTMENVWTPPHLQASIEDVLSRHADDLKRQHNGLVKIIP